MSTANTQNNVSGARRWKPYPVYKDSGIEWLGQIPAHWEAIPVKRLARIVNGATPRSSEADFWEGEIAWATPDDLGQLRTRFLKDTARHITKEGYASCGTTLVPPGSLVLSTRAPIGHLAVASREVCMNQGCRGLVLEKHDSSGYRYFSLLAARLILQSLGEGSTFRELPRDTLANVVLPNPSLQERSGIAGYLDRETAKIDALVDKKARLIELLQEKRTALITHAVTEGLDPNVPLKDSGIEWLGEIPAHWEIVPLKWLAHCYSGNAIDANYVEASLHQYTQVRVIGGNGLMGYTSKANVARPVLAIGRVGALCGNVHRVDPPAWVTDNALILEVDTQTFAYSYLQAILLSRNLNDLAAKTAQPLITGTQVRDQRLPCPPMREQQAIATFLDRETAKIDALLAKIQEAIKLLKEYRTALISAAVTGKIDVRGQPGEAYS